VLFVPRALGWQTSQAAWKFRECNHRMLPSAQTARLFDCDRLHTA
jgi:hypothetical protein